VSAYDIAVVGGGIVGAAVAHHLGLLGAGRVLVTEAGMPATRGATARSGGLFRLHHTAHCDVALAVRSLRTYQRWAEEVGGDAGYRADGFVQLVGEAYADALAKNVAAVNEHGAAAEEVSAADLVAAYPGLRVTDGILAAYEPAGGWVDPAAAARSLLASARRRGVTVAEGVAVTALLLDGDRVTGIRTNVGDVAAGTVVVCAGGWTAALLAGTGVSLPARPKRIGIVKAALASRNRLPAAIDDTLGTYFRPLDSALLVGISADPEPGPDNEPAPVTSAEAAAAIGRLTPRVPALAPAGVAGARSGTDAYTPDKHPLIGPAGPDGLYIGTGFSGGGAKLAPAVGELVAAELTGGGPSPLLGPYRPGRFDAGTPVVSEQPYAHM
jgi:sarcosine oxidase, subunit beta